VGSTAKPDPVEELAPLGPVVLGGDFNAPLELPETTEIEPLLKAGLSLSRTPDNRWTYRYRLTTGGQFDGFFTRGFGDRAGSFWVPAWPSSRRDAAFYREVSDHLPCFLEIAVPEPGPSTTDSPAVEAEEAPAGSSVHPSE